MSHCYKCKTEAGKGRAELRPYGPQGQMVCHGCAFATPESKAATEAAMTAQFEAAARADPDGIAAIGTEHGPLPLGTAVAAVKEKP